MRSGLGFGLANLLVDRCAVVEQPLHTTHVAVAARGVKAGHHRAGRRTGRRAESHGLVGRRLHCGQSNADVTRPGRRPPKAWHCTIVGCVGLVEQALSSTQTPVNTPATRNANFSDSNFSDSNRPFMGGSTEQQAHVVHDRSMVWCRFQRSQSLTTRSLLRGCCRPHARVSHFAPATQRGGKQT